jgi:type I restriction-modification system DNA methylase subunit
VFLKNRFDFVIGNPPWLTYSGITNADYQAEIKRLADDYQVTPASKANMPHLAIASVFLAHSVNYFLKPSGVLGFVLPRSFMSADQHDRTRGGETKGVKLISVWDLQDVSPLFRVPSCVFFATGFEGDGSPIPKAGIPGLTFAALGEWRGSIYFKPLYLKISYRFS